MGSVIETIVLLNVLLMWAWPWATFFFSLRRTFLAPALCGSWEASCLVLLEVVGPSVARMRQDRADYYFLPAFFLPATVLLGPLRVRALVWVR